MDRRNSMLLAVLAGALTGACRDESPTTTGPSTTGAAVTAAVTYTIKSLGTLGGTLSAALRQSTITGETVGWTAQDRAGTSRMRSSTGPGRHAGPRRPGRRGERGQRQ